MPMFASGPPSARREISLKSSCISMTIPRAGARIWESGPRSPSVSQVLRLSFLCLDFRARDVAQASHLLAPAQGRRHNDKGVPRTGGWARG
jgi:hypothetical protein